MKTWSLFLDDERFPPVSILDDWVIARTFNEAKNLIELNGIPWRMSLDHDLGENIPTGHDFIKWLIESDLDDDIDITEIKNFYVHSQNPVGAQNINSLFINYLNHRQGK